MGRVEKNIKRIKSEGKRKERKAGNRKKESESGKRKRRNSLTGSKPRGIRFVWGRWMGGGGEVGWRWRGRQAHVRIMISGYSQVMSAAGRKVAFN